jgi:plasmid replication initiation protein
LILLSQLIVKNNNFIEANYSMNLTEIKIITKLSSMIQKDDDDLNCYKFSLQELLKELNLGKKNYTNLIKALDKLLTRVIVIKKIDSDSVIKTTFLSSTEFFLTDGTVELSFDKKLKPYLLQLKKNFTMYQFKNVVVLSSFYAIRIYELCKQYEKIGKRIFELEELKEILGIKKTQYKLYGDFRVKVLEIAKREINAKTDLEIDFEGIKKVRKVTSIKFRIKKNENFEHFEEIEDFKEVEKIKEINYSEEVLNLYNVLPIEERLEDRKKELEKILKSHSYEMILGDINYCKNNAKDNFWGYFLKSLKSGHYGKVNIKKEKIKEEEKQKKIENKKLENQKIENEKNKLLEAKERNNILDEKYNLVDETAKKLIRDTADDIVENEGKKFPIKTIRESMFSTLYKYKAMEELMKYNLI